MMATNRTSRIPMTEPSTAPTMTPARSTKVIFDCAGVSPPEGVVATVEEEETTGGGDGVGLQSPGSPEEDRSNT